jgi:hypothetical protein
MMERLLARPAARQWLRELLRQQQHVHRMPALSSMSTTVTPCFISSSSSLKPSVKSSSTQDVTVNHRLLALQQSPILRLATARHFHTSLSSSVRKTAYSNFGHKTKPESKFKLVYTYFLVFMFIFTFGFDG